MLFVFIFILFFRHFKASAKLISTQKNNEGCDKSFDDNYETIRVIEENLIRKIGKTWDRGDSADP